MNTNDTQTVVLFPSELNELLALSPYESVTRSYLTARGQGVSHEEALAVEERKAKGVSTPNESSPIKNVCLELGCQIELEEVHWAFHARIDVLEDQVARYTVEEPHEGAKKDAETRLGFMRDLQSELILELISQR